MTDNEIEKMARTIINEAMKDMVAELAMRGADGRGVVIASCACAEVVAHTYTFFAKRNGVEQHLADDLAEKYAERGKITGSVL